MPIRKASGGKRRGEPRSYPPKKVAGIRNKLIENVRSGRRKKVNIDAVFSRIYAETGEIFGSDNLAQRLREANPEVEIIWGEIRPTMKNSKDVELSCMAILVAKKLNFRKAGMKFSDGWYHALENHFRENGRFPTYSSFRKDRFGTINRQGLERVRKQIIEHYWALLESKKT